MVNESTVQRCNICGNNIPRRKGEKAAITCDDCWSIHTVTCNRCGHVWKVEGTLDDLRESQEEHTRAHFLQANDTTKHEAQPIDISPPSDAALAALFRSAREAKE